MSFHQSKPDPGALLRVNSFSRLSNEPKKYGLNASVHEDSSSDEARPMSQILSVKKSQDFSQRSQRDIDSPEHSEDEIDNRFNALSDFGSRKGSDDSL